jgi:hypothetical protein
MCPNADKIRFCLVLWRVNLINIRVIMRRARLYYANRTFILALIPMFLIISSSVYPAIISTIQNKEMLIVAEAVAQLIEDNVDTSSHHATMPIFSSHGSPSSPTPIDPSFSATSTTSTQSNKTPKIQDQHEDKLTAAAIDAGDLVHVLWADNTPGNFEIFYKRDGADFDPTTINLSNNGGISDRPAIAVSGNNVHVVWQDTTQGNSDILYRRSTDGGANFGPTINLSNNAGFSFRPAIAVSGNNVHVVWDDDTPVNFDIFYRRSTDGGASFPELIKRLSSNSGDSLRPAIAVSGNNVHVVWDDHTPGNFDIFYRRSTDGGASFTEPIKNPSSNAGSSFNPAIALSGNNVYVVWDDNTSGTVEIIYRTSANNGDTFPAIMTNLSANTGTSSIPAIALS